MLDVKVFMMIFAIAAAYTDLEDNYFPTLLGDKEKLKQYFQCLVDKGPCDKFGKNDKNHVVEGLSDNCKECDTTQKHYTHILITMMKADFPDIYEAFEKKYDPKRILLENINTKTKDF